MLKTDKYYYSDAMFQLEINLHKVRRELITMLEFYEQTDCEKCSLLKCSCTKVDAQSASDKSNNRSDKRSTTNNTPCSKQVRDQNPPTSEVLSKTKREKSDLSPAPSTPEKVTVAKDIEAWMESSKKPDYNEKVVFTTKKSLVTIESVRPADLPLKTLQKSNVITTPSILTNNYMNNLSLLNSTSAVNNPTLEAFFKYFKHQMNDTQVVYMSAKLATACKNQMKQNYSYF
ncbi:uncharacterized protein LOC112049551 [Bicyclus anynana]|uniref:Uncharacterized protein LOC112049551 n=1 Tax=Bicyclus anynana TaxID=110368 RepID=A0A6J1NE23_BICAN|nr:uncharacterized protein LOC112049551 [Bicyclus anynana]